ncbi:hypothetical protein BMW23_0983 [Bodo saltans virus]|uniref:Transmembrane protein n=1 Tax=Bodo saltans virus TaxID=2024608 RepID=A0A2H4UVS0_9VIRU|nr:hypothetical protein QJ851_gp0965 [Bodo saltans virus]ATZ81028.1 hypothetical protein BMW23_0983 [Bodo saltans virus]
MENNIGLSCVPVNENTIFYVDIAIHVLFLLIIISTFFIFYGSKISTNAINDEIIDNVDKFNSIPNGNDILTGALGLNNDNNQGQKMLSMIQASIQGQSEIKTPNNLIDKIKNKLQENNKLRENNNNWVFETIIIFNIAVLVIVVLGIGLLTKQCNQCIDVFDIVKTNLMTFAFIGIVEVAFFYNVAIKYIPTKPSLLTNTIINRLKHNLSN